MSPNAELAGATIGHLRGLGVRDFVVCAGARNVPLVATLLEARESSGIRVWHHFDERTAAFFALGMAKRNGEAVAVLTTSGTAAAELLPATVEAYYSGVPLVLVTADRPESFRGSGAPQAIEQVGILEPYAPVSLDLKAPLELSEVVKWDRSEPLHLNVCFEEPGEEDRCLALPEIALPSQATSEQAHSDLSLEAFVAKVEGLVVLLGELPEDWRDPVENLLVRLGVPVWAEATSGLRECDPLGPQLLRLERDVSRFDPQRILRIGGVPSLRFWRDLEELSHVEVLSVTRRPFSGLARSSRLLTVDSFPDLPEIAHHGDPVEEGGYAGLEFNRFLEQHPRSEAAMVWELSKRIPDEALVFLGNSLPIREWNLAATVERPHESCFANRGANGIDGEIATFLGMGIGAEESWGIFGDLTALYDLNAPALLSQLGEGRRRIVILNNGGGRIFSRLPSMRGLANDEKVVSENRHEFQFGAWAEMWGMDYLSWKAGDPMPDVGGDAVVIEMLLDEEASEAFWGEMR